MRVREEGGKSCRTNGGNVCKHLPIENRVNRVELKMIIREDLFAIFRLQIDKNCETFRKKCINCPNNMENAKAFVYFI
jgi:hypothetical protein